MLVECPHAQRAFNERGELIVMACDGWNCPVCQKANSYRWAERIKYGIELWKPYDAYMWTLTLPPWVRYPKTGFRILPDCWDRFRRKLQKVYPRWHYAAFVECHPQRALIPHFHVISLSAAPIRLKDLAVSAGFGYEAKEKQITSKGAAGYVTKYCTKQGYAMPRGFRRIRVSRSWPRLPDPLYPFAVYPMRPKETTKAYIRRIARLTGEEYGILLSRWLS